MVQLTITHANGNTETIAETSGWTRRRELGKMRRAQIDVERSLADAVTLVPKSDSVALGSIDDLRLVDIDKGGSTWTLTCYSYEWDANRVDPTVGGDERTGTDDALVTQLINQVPTWSAGTVNSFTGSLSFVFNHALRHEALRRIERNTPGEVKFRDQGTVDYVQALGSDRSGSVELSASEGTIEEAIEITERGRKLDGTHVRVLGAHEGEAQLFANLVPQSDSASYDNRVDYSTSRWSQGDTRDWDRWENKDLADQATLDEEAAALGDEITEGLVEAKTLVSGVDPPLNVGDWVQVVKEEPDGQGGTISTLDRRMRVHRIKTKASGSTRRDEVLLSTRTIARDDNVADLRDIRKFNTGWQGASVAINAGPFARAVDSSNSLDFNFKYPGLEYENAAGLHIKGLEYRVDSQGAAAGGGTTETTDGGGINSATTASGGGSVTDQTDIPDGSTPSSATFTGVSATMDTWVMVSGEVGNTPDPPVAVSISLYDGGSSGATQLDTVTVETSANGPFATTLGAGANERSNTSLTVEVTAVDTLANSVSISNTDARFIGVPQHTHQFDWLHDHTVTLPDHTHPVDAGIFTSGDTPSGVDVSINGSQVASNVGTGTFETVVDVAGEFQNDAWNTVTVTSDSLGIIEVAAFIEGYDQIGLR